MSLDTVLGFHDHGPAFKGCSAERHAALRERGASVLGTWTIVVDGRALCLCCRADLGPETKGAQEQPHRDSDPDLFSTFYGLLREAFIDDLATAIEGPGADGSGGGGGPDTPDPAEPQRSALVTRESLIYGAIIRDLERIERGERAHHLAQQLAQKVDAALGKETVHREDELQREAATYADRAALATAERDEARQGLAQAQEDVARLKREVRSGRAALHALVETLPRCSGRWEGGSGAHRRHGPCSRIATWVPLSDPYAYCDEHITPAERGRDPIGGYPEAPWAAWVRRATTTIEE